VFCPKRDKINLHISVSAGLQQGSTDSFQTNCLQKGSFSALSLSVFDIFQHYTIFVIKTSALDGISLQCCPLTYRRTSGKMGLYPMVEVKVMKRSDYSSFSAMIFSEKGNSLVIFFYNLGPLIVAKRWFFER
jgi:hypothetical protein